MKTLYLHIGTHKTATSALQLFLKNNRRQLHKYNYEFPLIYPKHPNAVIQRNAHFLSDSSSGYDEALFPEREIEEDTLEMQQLRQKRLSNGLKAIHKAFQKYDNVILTDECLWISFSYNQIHPLEILREDAKEYQYTIKVIVYLRRQDQYLLSQWNQHIKNRPASQTFQEYLDKVLSGWPLVVDYAASLDNIAQHIGKENMTVRRFDSSFWIGGSIYSDFLDALGLDPDLPLEQPKKFVNTSLTLNHVEIQRQLNMNEKISKKQKDFLGYCLRRASAKCPEHPEYGMLSTAETQAFLAGFEVGNNRVAREYLDDTSPLFSTNIKDTRKWHPANEYMEEDFICYLSTLSKIALGTGLLRYKCGKLYRAIYRKLLSR
ncbi:MAG: hypothetical protein LIO99_14425 [Clostridiales bacterium]|nr:hypothetical protein [Clostridiales bacterium]